MKKLSQQQEAEIMAKWKAYIERAYRIRSGLEPAPPIQIFRATLAGSTEDVP
jgi:hypothetical protein